MMTQNICMEISYVQVRPVYVIDVYKLTPSNGPKERSRRARDLTVASDNLSAIEFRPGYLASEWYEGDNDGEMSPGSSTESYPAFAHIGLRENPGKNLNQVLLQSNLDLVSQPDVLAVTPQSESPSFTTIQNNR
ncbi:hypothetical protein ANN_19442 [Periplaneta americana]|uniref:Uncharacterized protein n=1 Tax=Periplaneta americana TaxID=6978 RepID=A0ABQ8SB09_PERAM|nr:hypothetical protein ANN_19442 [Periplaneta americana]